MAHHDIEVTLDASNNVVVTPKQQHAHSSHTVRWICRQGALRIAFPGPECPLKTGLTVNAPSGTTSKRKLRKPSKKQWKYTAEVTPPGGPTFSVDPDLIIDDGGGGGAKKKKTKKDAKAQSKKKK